MAMLVKMGKGNYKNKDAAEKVVRYTTRTRVNEDRGEELVAWGGMGVGCYATPELAIRQIRCVQVCYNIEERNGRRMFHEVLNITDEEFGWMGHSYDAVYQIAMKCAGYYYAMGFQVVFAVHHAKDKKGANKGVHIHFAVNTVNFQTGRKWHTNMRESYTRERAFDKNMWEFERRDGIEPFEFV